MKLEILLRAVAFISEPLVYDLDKSAFVKGLAHEEEFNSDSIYDTCISAAVYDNTDWLH